MNNSKITAEAIHIISGIFKNSQSIEGSVSKVPKILNAFFKVSDSAVIIKKSKDSNKFSVFSDGELFKSKEFANLSFFDSLPGNVFKSKKTSFVDNINNLYGNERKFYDAYGVKSILAAPLFHGLDSYGVSVIAITGFNSPDKDFIELFNIFSNQISLEIFSKFKEIDLSSAKEKAVEADKMKSTFLANMSHELRTPLNGILGFSELISNGTDNAYIKHLAQIIFQSSKRLMETLDMILDLSKIESGKLKMNLVDQDITLMLGDIIRFYELYAARKKLKLSFNLPSRPIIVKIDDRMFREIINNLIDNAIKYTNEGEINVDVSVDNISGSDFAVIIVSDTGIGIPESAQKTVFDEFRQVSEGYARDYEGAGLGLTISKRFAEKLGGEIFLQSQPGKGTVVTLRLPLSKASIKDGIIVKSPVEQEKDFSVLNIEDYKILGVDDDDASLELLSLFLRGVAHIDLVRTGKAAIEKAHKTKYDIIFMDINLGTDITGLDAVKHIRAIDGYENTPVVAITAFAMKGDREKFLSSGCTHYIAKPFSRKEFFELLNSIVNK